MKKLFELITLAALSSNPYFTVGHNSEAMYDLYKTVIDGLTKKS